MKFAKRLLSAVLVCSVLLTCFVVMPVSAAFTDVEDTDRNAQAITVLNKLGVINGYDDGTFRPNNNVTRAEFTAMLLRTRGMGTVGSTSLENPPFPDVTTPDVSWAIGNIRTARQMGIINGYDDGTFKPNNNVTYQEAVKMIVCALGYGEMGVEGPEWYTRYMVSAQTLGFINGSGGAVNTPATRETIAVMLYNCLEVNLAENNKVTEKTILENDLKLTKKVGYIDSTPEISLSKADANLRDDEVQISVEEADGTIKTDTYKTDNAAQYADMLGAQITFYYNSDRTSNFNTLLFATVKNTETLEIEASQINDANESSISYYRNEDSNRTIEAKIDDNSVVVYNNRLYKAKKEESTFSEYYTDRELNGFDPVPSIGKIKLLDRDGDKKYDVVFIDSYEAWYVSSATSSNKTVTDNVLRKGLSNDLTKLVLEEEGSSTKIIIRKMDGTSASFSSITRGSILCVKESNPENGGVIVKEVVICNNSVSGTITSTNSKSGVTIGGVTYKFSRQNPWRDEETAERTGIAKPGQGDGGKFYLDIDGNIITYDKTEESVSQLYGYIMDADYDDDVIEGESLRLHIIDEKGKKDVYTVDSRTRIDDEIMDLDDAKDYLYNDGSYSQLIKFTLAASRGSNVLGSIVTADPSSEKTSSVASNVLNLYDGISLSEEFEYNATNRQFYTVPRENRKTVNLHNAIIIKVPEDRTATNKYRKISYNELREGEDDPDDPDDDDTRYNIEVYDISTTNAAKVVLVFGERIADIGEVNEKSPVMVITEEPIWNGERLTIEGYVGTTPKTYELSNEDSDTLDVAGQRNRKIKKGDVVRLGTDAEGYATIKEENIIFSSSYNRNAWTTPREEVNETSKAAFRAYWGSWYNADEDLVLTMISENVIIDPDDDPGEQHQFEGRLYDGAQIFTYDLTDDADDEFITIHPTAQNENELKSLAICDPETDTVPAEVFVYVDYNSVKTVIIIER